MDIPKDAEEKIAQLQMLEQNIQAFSSQRQGFQLQLAEIDNALKELENTKEKAFKIIGNLMIESNVDELKKDLKSKKETISLRVKNLEGQEKKLREKAESLQKEVMGVIKEKEGK